MSYVLSQNNYKCLTCKKCLITCQTDTLKSCSRYELNDEIIDKKITVILNTYRRSDKYLSESIQSFLKQTYKNSILQITNTHPKPLVLDRQYDNIIIYNIKDVFGQYPRHAVWSVFKVKTPYFTILDDDDLYMPTYLEEFNSVIEKYPNQYIQIIRNKRIFDNNGKIENKVCNGWGGRLFSRFKVSDLERKLRIKPFNKYQGIDNYLAWKIHTGKKIKVSLPSTYITRRQNDVAHIYKRCDNGAKVVKNRISSSKRQVYGGRRLDVVVPFWEKNYSKEYKKYV